MVKSVKRCLHWHVISRLIYNSIIDTINLSAGPETCAGWVTVAGQYVRAAWVPRVGSWGCWADVHQKGQGPPGSADLGQAASKRMRLPSLQTQGSWSFCWHVCVWCPFIHLFGFYLNKTKQQNLTQENSVCPPLAPSIFQFLQ